MLEISFKADIDDAIKDLKSVGVNTDKISKKILSKVASVINNKAKQGARKILKRRTGNFISTLYRRVNPWNAKISSFAQYIAQTQEYGARILPKKGKYLTFKTEDGKWIKTKEVNVKPKNWFSKSVDSYLSSNQIRLDMENILIKEVQKQLGNW